VYASTAVYNLYMGYCVELCKFNSRIPKYPTFCENRVRTAAFTEAYQRNSLHNSIHCIILISYY